MTVARSLQAAAEAAHTKAVDEAKRAQDLLQREQSVCEDLKERIQEALQR